MNSLDRDLHAGDIIVIAAAYAPEREDRRMRVRGGTGCTMRNASLEIGGYWLSDNAFAIVLGTWIDALETEAACTPHP